MRLVQHKKEAYWFYRFLSIFYDDYVNPFFWTARMRDEALTLARLDDPALETVDVGAGSIEYWPDTLSGIAEAYLVDKKGGVELSQNQTCAFRSFLMFWRF